MDLHEERQIEPEEIAVSALEDGKIQSAKAKSRPHAVYQSVPGLDPPRDWNDVGEMAWVAYVERNARTELPGRASEQAVSYDDRGLNRHSDGLRIEPDLAP